MKDMKKKRRVKLGWGDSLYLWIVRIFVVTLAAMCLFPILNLLAVSLSDTNSVIRGEVYLIPKGFTLEVYADMWKKGAMLKSMIYTIWIVILYTIVTMTMTILCAYPLSMEELRGKKVLFGFIMVTMYFGGGMIPTYLLVNNLGLIDSIWALILPGALSTYNMLVMRANFLSIPASLRESAYMDGAGDGTVLIKIVLPLSKAAIATVSLFYMVGRWNGYIDALLYINDSTNPVLQIKLREMIFTMTMQEKVVKEGLTAELVPLETVRAGSIMFAMIPVLLVYPWLQKYFVKGAMVGAIKG